MYTWVPTHKAIVQKLMAYEHRQQELITILKNVGEKTLNDKDHDGLTIGLDEIDPFTFFCYIYKYGEEKRLQQLQKIAQAFNIEPLPEDEKGIPSAYAQKVWLFPFKRDRNNKEIERLWTFFKAAVNGQVTNDLFEDILKIKGTGKTKISEGLFSIDPEQYLPINSQSRPYHQVPGIDPDLGVLWTKWLEAASAYYNEIKDTRLKGVYKRFTNLAVIKSLFDVEFRESLITEAMAYGSFPAQ